MTFKKIQKMEPDNLDSFIRALKQENRQTRWDDSGFEQAVQEKIARKEQAMQNAPITLAHFRFFSQAVAPIAALFLIVFLWAYTPRLVPDGKAVETAASSKEAKDVDKNTTLLCPPDARQGQSNLILGQESERLPRLYQAYLNSQARQAYISKLRDGYRGTCRKNEIPAK